MIVNKGFKALANKCIKGIDVRTVFACKYSSQATKLGAYGNFDGLRIEQVADHVLNLQIHRPKKRNAMDSEMIIGLKNVFTTLNDDSHFRVAIISATGDYFSAGIDLNFFQSSYPLNVEDVGRRSMHLKKIITGLQDSIKAVASCQKPIICAISGGCIGLGVDLISAADIRYCSKETFFQVREVELGLAADMGSLQFLPLVVSNQSFIREAIFSGRRFSPEEALQFGLVSKILTDGQSTMSEAIDLAKLIASRSPIAVQGSKICADHSRDHGVWDGFKYNATWNMAMLQTEDLAKSAMAIMTKSEKPPKFEDF